MDNAKYLRVLKIAQIPMEVASVICSAPSEETLNRITKVGFDRRYIYPVIELAAVMSDGLCDENVNEILNDPNKMSEIKCRVECE